MALRGRPLAVLAWCALAQRAAAHFDAKRKLESARLYGNIDGYAYYFVDLVVGTPPQRASVILDTGSGVCAFPCKGCPHCGKHLDPNFDVARSSSAKWVGCGAKNGCSGSCNKGHCSYSQSYLEGSSISGFWFDDYLSLGDQIQENPRVMARMGCHQNENKLFYTQKANGIFGIQGPRSLLHTLFKDKQHVDSSVFSICLAEEGGRLTVGGHNATHHTGELQYIRQTGSRYSVQLSSMKINGQTISGFKTTLIDSGTTYTYLARNHYQALRKAIESFCSSKGCGGAKRSGTCYNVAQLYPGLAHFPPVEMLFGSAKIVWKPREYLYRKGKTSTWCYAFENDGATSTTTLGASWMLYKEVVFDIAKNKIGIVSADCPSYVARPAHKATMPVPAAAPPAAPKNPAPTPNPTAVPAIAKPATEAAGNPSPPVKGTVPASSTAAPPLQTAGKVAPRAPLQETLPPAPRVSDPPPTRMSSTNFNASIDWRSPGPLVISAVALALVFTTCAFVFCARARFGNKHRHTRVAVTEPKEVGVLPGVVGTAQQDDDLKDWEVTIR